MKKIIAFAWVLLWGFGLSSCSGEMSFDIAEADKIEIRSGNTGATVERSDEEEIAYITDNINALTFSKGKSGKNSSGWSYWLKWYDSEDNLIEEIIVMSECQIDYEDYFYTCTDTDLGIDTAFFDELLNEGK